MIGVTNLKQIMMKRINNTSRLLLVAGSLCGFQYSLDGQPIRFFGFGLSTQYKILIPGEDPVLSNKGNFNYGAGLSYTFNYTYHNWNRLNFPISLNYSNEKYRLRPSGTSLNRNYLEIEGSIRCWIFEDLIGLELGIMNRYSPRNNIISTNIGDTNFNQYHILPKASLCIGFSGGPKRNLLNVNIDYYRATMKFFSETESKLYQYLGIRITYTFTEVFRPIRGCGGAPPIF